MRDRFGHILPCFLLTTVYSLLLYSYPPGWSDDIRVSLPGQDCSTPDIAIDSSCNIWIVWHVYHPPYPYPADIYYAKLDSCGNFLIPPTDLTQSPNIKSWFSRIAVDQRNRVHIIWREPGPHGYAVYYARLDEQGKIEIGPKMLIDAPTATFSWLRDEIEVDREGHLAIVWDGYTDDYRVFYSEADTGGNLSIDSVNVSPGLDASNQEIGVDTFQTMKNHIFFRSFLPPSIIYNIFYSRLDDQGNPEVLGRRVSHGDRKDLHPAAVTDGAGNVHCVYSRGLVEGSQLTSDPYYFKLDSMANYLIPETDLYPDPHLTGSPDITIDLKQRLHLIWDQTHNIVSRSWLTYTVLDTAAHFLIEPMTVVDTLHILKSSMPRIAVDKHNRVHLVWQDVTQSPIAVYYKYGDPFIDIEEKPKATISPPSFYPNPFNDVLRIHKKGRISVYDITGRFIADLTGKKTWQPIGLPSGVYILTIREDDKLKTLPVIYLR